MSERLERLPCAYKPLADWAQINVISVRFPLKHSLTVMVNVAGMRSSDRAGALHAWPQVKLLVWCSSRLLIP